MGLINHEDHSHCEKRLIKQCLLQSPLQMKLQVVGVSTRFAMMVVFIRTGKLWSRNGSNMGYIERDI